MKVLSVLSTAIVLAGCSLSPRGVQDAPTGEGEKRAPAKLADRFKVSLVSARHRERMPELLRLHCEIGILDPNMVLGITEQGIITQIESDKREVIDVARPEWLTESRLSYAIPSYREGHVAPPETAKQQPQWIDVLEPFEMRLEFEAEALGSNVEKINRIEGYFSVFTAKSIEYLDIPFEAGDKWYRLPHGVEIRLVEAKSTESSCNFKTEARSSGETFDGRLHSETDLPERLPICQQLLRADGKPNRPYPSRLSVPGIGPGSSSMSGGNAGPVEKIRYTIAVNPEHCRIPFVFENISLPDPPVGPFPPRRVPPGAQVREKAHTPNPPHGPDQISLKKKWTKLSWGAGAGAVSHNVYVGDNFDDVDRGTGDTFRGNQSTTEYLVGFAGFPFPDGLVPGTTYYWRIDEVNDTDPNNPCKGDTWSFSIPPKTAYNPYPTDGAESVDPNVVLSWTKGFGAKLHTVYFGDNFDDVKTKKGRPPQRKETYTPGPLELNKTYYWRVDEFDPPKTYRGDVWSFTVGDATKAEPD